MRADSFSYPVGLLLRRMVAGGVPHRFRGPRCGRVRPWCWLLCLLLGCFGLAMAWGQTASSEVRLLNIDGVINPLTANYLERQLREAERTRSDVVIVQLNTPGGLERSMRRMTEIILASPVPVVVYVAPSGARAASAGMFLTLAAHVSAMAPGTNIGAAHPVSLSGEGNAAGAEKAVQDAAALARALAETRGRNVSWAEKAVRESVSITATEARRQNVVDLIAVDVPDLLRQLDGRQVLTAGGSVTLQTQSAPVTPHPMTLFERILLTVIDPNIAYLLFTLGSIGIIAELYHPGALFPGITGAISLILAFTAFGSLPVNWAGLLLLVLAFGLFLGELHTSGVGILGAAALVAFILGSLLLFSPVTPPSPTMPVVRVSPWLIFSVTLFFGAFFLWVLKVVLASRHAPVRSGSEALIGRYGQVTRALAPRGIVRVDGEAWTAETLAEPVEAGAEVQIADVEGVTLKVRRVP